MCAVRHHVSISVMLALSQQDWATLQFHHWDLYLTSVLELHQTNCWERNRTLNYKLSNQKNMSINVIVAIESIIKSDKYTNNNVTPFCLGHTSSVFCFCLSSVQTPCLFPTVVMETFLLAWPSLYCPVKSSVCSPGHMFVLVGFWLTLVTMRNLKGF